nr:MAG TPA: hypothetical protein [Caudoviricetes sp.]
MRLFRRFVNNVKKVFLLLYKNLTTHLFSYILYS